MSTFTAIIQLSEVLPMAVREEKEIKESLTRKEVKLSLSAPDMTPYLENHEDSTRKLLEFISKLAKSQATKLIHRHQLHLYILTMKDQKEKNQRNHPIYYRIKNNKINRSKPT